MVGVMRDEEVEGQCCEGGGGEKRGGGRKERGEREQMRQESMTLYMYINTCSCRQFLAS